MNRRQLLLPVGVLATGAGVVLTLRPGLVPSPWLTSGFVLGVWVVGLLGAGVAVLGRLTGDEGETGRLPTAGERPAYRVPGDGLADRTAAVGASDRHAAERDRIRDRLRDAAVAVLARREGIGETDAADSVDAGDWTDDADAAALFAGTGSRHDHVETGFARRVDAVADAVADLFETDSSTGAESKTAAESGTATESVTLALDPGEELLERSGRWRGIQGLALAVTAVGILVGAPLVILSGVVGVAFAAYARVWDAPAPTLAVERTVSEPDPRPGERVEVTLSVRNRGDRLLPDVRICDDVPAGLRVVDGTPRHTTALRPGKTATISYTVEAVRGEHSFDSLAVVTRDISAASRRVARLPTESATVACRPPFGEHSVSLGDLATLLSGRTNVAETGTGVSFHSLREHRRGDPLGSLDWGHLAKTGEFATRRYDEPRTVRVAVLVDARAAAYVTADERHRRPAVDVCTCAAGALVAGLLDDGALVGLGAVGPRPCWVPAGNGRDHRERLLRTLTGHEAFDWQPPEPVVVGDRSPDGDQSQRATDPTARVVRSAAASEDGGVTMADTPAGGRTVAVSDGGSAVVEGESAVAGDGPVRADGSASTDQRDADPTATAKTLLDDLGTRLPADAQVVFCTPLADDASAAVARQLRARGHDVLVASPDIMRDDTPCRRLAGVERRLRLDGLRRDGVTVHEWTPPTDPTAGAGWSA
jgi:uncharacterized repeat protein (TIGR01451 family)